METAAKYIANLQDLLQELEPAKKQVWLIAIDGRPCSGKTTLTEQLVEPLDAQTMYLDEFFIPPTQWANNIIPAFPFPYIRYQEFIKGIKTLAAGKAFHYYSHDWQANRLASEPTTISPNKTIIIEGISVLSPELVGYYDKKIWVDSASNTEYAAIVAREKNKNLDLWNSMYIPSVDIYCQTKPWLKADIVYAGRGIHQKDAV